jgi:hypothetical protein
MRAALAGHRWVRSWLFAVVALAALAGTPRTAHASCAGEAVSGCNALFGGGDWRTIGIRGWCYMIWTAWCELES